MALISKKEFEQLAETHDAHCISIFIPTYRAGKEVDDHEGENRLKNHLKEITTKLSEYGLTDDEIGEYLMPLRKLLNDLHFWRNQSDGLAIFLSSNTFKYYTVPVNFYDFNYVADHFYLKPLLPLFNHDGKFFILALGLHNVRFFEATKHGITPVDIADIVPSKEEEVVGYDYEQKSLQFRTENPHLVPGPGRALYFGHSEWKDMKKTEIGKFLRQVDKGLMKMLHDEYAPMILACVDYLFPIYKEVNSYNYLYDKHISGSPDEADTISLHEEAWDLLEPHFESNRKKKTELFGEKLSKGTASYELDKIVPAAINGKIDTLFIQNDSEQYGQYNPQDNTLTMQLRKQKDNTDLLNLAAVKTFLQGGEVYLLSPEEMPEKQSVINALFRY